MFFWVFHGCFIAFQWCSLVFKGYLKDDMGVFMSVIGCFSVVSMLFFSCLEGVSLVKAPLFLARVID